MKPIYEPKGKAKEYGDLAINIYTGCPHRCYYCFAPGVLHRDKEEFHSHVEPRPGIVEAVKDQIEREHITGKLIHLCFTCDPYPTGYDSTATREIIKIIKASGNHVQILTKGDGSRDFDLLDSRDWYGITFSQFAKFPEPDSDVPFKVSDDTVPEPEAVYPTLRLMHIVKAKKQGIKTWISFEPVLSASDVFNVIERFHAFVDKVKVGKLNYHPSTINWHDFGQKAEALCRELGIDYYIKDSLRKEMEK